MGRRWGARVTGGFASALVCAVSCGGRIAETPTVTTSVPYIAPRTPVSGGAASDGAHVIVTVLDVLGGIDSCDVLEHVNVSNVKGAFQITLTFPAGTRPGAYALADIGAKATILVTDQSCGALYTDTTTQGEVWLARNDTEVDGYLKASFSQGTVLVENLTASMCSSPPAASDGSCAVLPYCTTSGSLSCFFQT